MGVFLILLGLLAAGVVADFVVENGFASGPNPAFQLFGSSFHLSMAKLVLGSAIVGGLAITLLVLGLGLLKGSWGRRRGLKRKISDLERENAELRSKAQGAAAPREKPF